MKKKSRTTVKRVVIKKSDKKAKRNNPYQKWMILGVVLAIATYVYTYNQRILGSDFALTMAEMMGVESVPAEINLIAAGRPLPLSDDPVVNAIGAAHRAKLEVIQTNKPKNKEEEAKVEELANAAAQSAATLAVQQTNAALQANSTTVQRPSTTQTDKQVVHQQQEDVKQATDTLNKYLAYTYDNGKVKTNFRQYSNLVDVDGGAPLCKTEGSGGIIQYYTVGSYIRASKPGICEVCVRKEAGGSVTGDFVDARCGALSIKSNTGNVDAKNQLKCALYKNPNSNVYSQHKLEGYEVVLMPNNSAVDVSLLIDSKTGHREEKTISCRRGNTTTK